MQKWYIDKKFRMLVNTQMFITFDLYVFEFDTIKGEEWMDIFADNFKNASANINDIDYNYNPIKMNDVISSIDKKTVMLKRLSAHKLYNHISLDSHADMYNFNFAPETKEVFFLQIKKFDVDNYIAPVSVYVDNEYMISNENNINIESMTQELDNTSDLKTTLAEYKKLILT